MLRRFAQFISIVFHPLLILTYSLIMLLMVNPYMFGVNNVMDQSGLVLIVFLSTFFLPGVAVLIMWALNLVDSIELKTQNERIGPYILTGVFYLWMVVNFKDNPNIPTAFTIFMLGATIGLFAAFFINIFMKISTHTVGMGGLIGMVMTTMALFSYGSFTISIGYWGAMELSVNILLMVVLILAGLVGTCRLILQAHSNLELYSGYVVGIFSQMVAMFYFMI